MLVSALILGLLGSLHCVGMCGPIAFMLPVDRSNNFRKALQISSYHLGRIFTYAIIGGLFGFLGKGFYIFGLQQQLSIGIGVLMIFIVVLPTKTFQKYNFSKYFYSAVGKVKSALGKSLKKKSADTFFTIGFLNGFLPCGLLYIAIFASLAAGSVLQSSLYMMVFGLGTVPLMTTSIYFMSFLKGKTRQKVRRLIPVFVVITGLLFILRGMGLGIPYVSPKPVTELVSSAIECH